MESTIQGFGIWAAVKELKLSYHNGYIYIITYMVSPIW